MPLFPPDRINSIFREIKSRGSTDSPSILILVALEPDALCSLKILTNLLKNDSLQFSIVPVISLDHITQANVKYVENSDTVKNIILINCGGMINIASYFDNPEVKIYLFDSHRPFNLGNIFNARQVRVVGEDESINGELSEAYRVVELEEYDFEYAISDSESDNDLADDDPAKEIIRNQRRRQKLKRVMDQSRNRVATYINQGLHFGTPTTILFFGLAESQGTIKSDYLWWSAIGLSFHFTTHRCSKEQYFLLQRSLAAKVQEHNSTRPGAVLREVPRSRSRVTLQQQAAAAHQRRNTVSATPYNRPQYLDGASELRRLKESLGARLSGSSPRPTTTSSPVSSKDAHIYSSSEGKLAIEGQVIAQDAFKFPCLHYWSLYGAMVHSPYVAARLGVWMEVGLSRFRNLLAKMGVSLVQSQRPFPYMDMTLRDDIQKKLTKLGPSYGLTDIVYPSFARNCGYSTVLPLQAADAAASLRALFKLSPVLLNRLTDLGRSALPRKTGGLDDLAQEDSRIEASALNNLVQNFDPGLDGETIDHDDDDDGMTETKTDSPSRASFYTAYDALDRMDLMKSGVELAKHFQKEAISQGISIISQNDIKSFKTFRLALVREGSSIVSFLHPDSLSELGHFLTNVYNSPLSKGGSDSRPLIIAAYNSNRNSFLVAGCVNDSNNPFGFAFQHEATRLKVQIVASRLDTSVLEIDEEDFSDFLSHLVLPQPNTDKKTQNNRSLLPI